jgi:ATP-dependent exoDNAse (exonuclease V) beta subunit
MTARQDHGTRGPARRHGDTGATEHGTSTLADARARELIATALDDTLIVEAAAGTGKTTALVGRIVAILTEGRAEVGEIVAVTFTEKAAGELKLRLRERLDAARAAEPDDSPRRSLLDRALTSLEEAHVSTIHGFCADLLRERPVEAGVDPLFEVLTESASARLFDDAFGRWLQEQLADPSEGVRRALRRTSFGGDDGPVDRLRKAAWDLAQWRDFEGTWTRNPFDRKAEIDALVGELHDFANLTRNPGYQSDPLFVGTDPARRLSDEIGLQQAFGDRTADADYDGWEARLIDLARDRTLANARQGRGASYGSGVARSEVLRARDDLKARLDQFRMTADGDLAALLQQELKGAIERYEALKARAGALDFLDLLLGARNLVRDNPQVREGFQKRFKRIFVDEFQDTDPLQAEILLLLASDDPRERNWKAVRPVPGRLFLVGDPKQSIYRFRRADVAVYRDVCRRLAQLGATEVKLTTSFRSVRQIQACVNAAFEPVMTGDELTLQADYVPLSPHRPDLSGQPAIVALPVPEPYARRNVSGFAVEKSLPQAVAALVDWIVTGSGWRVTERSGEAPVPVAAKHVCVLFRRFISYETDMTRPYVEALEVRGIPHVLVGGKAFHEREEVEAIRAALAAIEWPDDELSVFATLRGPFFAIGDEDLLEWAHRFGSTGTSGFRRYVFHPFRVPEAFAADTAADLEHLRPIANALALLRRLHRRRNYIPVSATMQELLGETRAHVGFALRNGGEQALANVLHVAELARQFEIDGGLSFRGFVDELRTAAETAQASEAPILEEDSDGVRMMTVHKAKGLEFPIVILADLTCKLSRPEAGRWIDPEGRTCALKLGGWAPIDLLLHDAEESARDRAEGQRLAYVAATRARDVLIVPVIGDEIYDGGWLDPLMPAVHPPPSARRQPGPAAGCPAFPSKDSVLTRPDDEPARPQTVAPGAYLFGADGGDKYAAVWWDPHVLALDAPSSGGLRRDDLIAKDGDQAAVQARLDAFRTWEADRAAAIERARTPSINVRTATDLARNLPATDRLDGDGPDVDLVDLSPPLGRPYGPRFGSLVHATLATVPLDASSDVVERVARTQGRILLATDEETTAAAEAVSGMLRHDLFDRARAAESLGRCSREVPVMWMAPDGTLVEGTVDLAFQEGDTLTVLDFKTDRELAGELEHYRNQLKIYCRALGAGREVRAALVRV